MQSEDFRLGSDKTQLSVLLIKFDFIKGGGLTLPQIVSSLKIEVCVCPAWLSLYRPHVGGRVKDGGVIGLEGERGWARPLASLPNADNMY